MGGTRRDWLKLDHLKWIAAGCALIATATAEHKLAVRIGMHDWVAACVPGALDAYVVRALRAHREVFASVLAMVGVNAASHLVKAGHVPVDWPLITAVSAIAPLVLWRVHALGTSTVNVSVDHEGGGHGENAPAPSVLESDTPPIPHQLPRALGEHADTFDEHADAAVSAVMPDYVPDSWKREHEERDACSACSGPVTYDEHDGWLHDDVSATCVLNEHATGTALPALPPGFVPADTHDVHADVLAVLTPADMPYLGRARSEDERYMGEHGEHVTVNEIKRTVRVGTGRAQRLRAAVLAEHAVRARAREGGHDDD